MIDQNLIFETRRGGAFDDIDAVNRLGQRYALEMPYSYFPQPYNQATMGVIKADTFEILQNYFISKDGYHVLLTYEGQVQRITIGKGCKYLVFKKP